MPHSTSHSAPGHAQTQRSCGPETHGKLSRLYRVRPNGAQDGLRRAPLRADGQRADRGARGGASDGRTRAAGCVLRCSCIRTPLSPCFFGCRRKKCRRHPLSTVPLYPMLMDVRRTKARADGRSPGQTSPATDKTKNITVEGLSTVTDYTILYLKTDGQTGRTTRGRPRAQAASHSRRRGSQTDERTRAPSPPLRSSPGQSRRGLHGREFNSWQLNC